MTAVASAIAHSFNGDPFQRVIYSESHDEVANGRQRVVSEIQPDDPSDWYARKRSTLAAGIVFTAPGVPMIFQGQEFLQAGYFEDTVPLDWDLTNEHPTVLRFYRDLVACRTNRGGYSKGLTAWGCRLTRIDEEKNLLAYHRYEHGGHGDDVMVVANFSHEAYEGFRIGLPSGGIWRERLNSNWSRYIHERSSPEAPPMEADDLAWDGLPASLELAIPPYSLLILSQ
jgi:1,4-alpha-glucan branching enzyme